MKQGPDPGETAAEVHSGALAAEVHSGALAAIVAQRVYVFGHVQGVFFRASARTQARALGVTGWVRNLADGRVEAWLEGTSDAVSTMLDWCRMGPANAHVEAVDLHSEHPEGHLDFEIRSSAPPDA
ncbi:MAG: acylphosphatase [Deltaproteobacteria bacterium]|nr:acylphosphatase [Deltaproteobacteria bacterium]MCB9786446.1 acylphosphatase [Deltaproteobacteria bacterium]